MISSEVQRTLVKSPPELWTELSDPESLARHLGELGEIRITRTVPENLVEWEAEGTTGTVEIAPSGWGTRVTLTVLRELPAVDGADAQPEASVAESEQPEAEAAAENVMPEAAAASTAASEADMEPQAEAPSEAVAVPEAETRTHADPAVPDPPEAARSEPMAERTPAPATEAARRAAGWPSTGHPPGPAIESDLRAAEERSGSSPEPDGLHAWAAQSAETEASPEGAEPSDDRLPEDETPAKPDAPRRGLFARLFGRRRAKEPAPQQEPCDDSLGDATVEALGDGEPEGTGPQLEAADTDGPQAATEDLSCEAGGEESETEQADLAARGPAEPWAEDVGAEAPAESAGAEIEQAGVAAPAEPEPDPGVEHEAEMTADAAGFAADAEPTEPAGASEPQAEQPPAPATPVEDLAAELRAAEDVAAEQVQAVLSGVLDRLGSAHHRPFSRS
jgi:hypothetical protein